MKKTLGILFFMLALSIPAFPVGFGFYGTGGYGRVDMMKIIDNGNDYRVIYSTNNSVYGGGLLLESGSDSGAYHNRLNFGVEGSTLSGGRYRFSRFMRAAIDNVFAFRLAESEAVRFWMGPLIGIQLLTGHAASTRNSEWPDDKFKYHLSLLSMAASPVTQLGGLYYLSIDHVWKRKFGVFIPLGVAMGINIRMGENAALTVEGGFRCGLYYLRNAGFNYEGYGNAGFIFGAM
ncbi:MAG TPA: hypothetical protein PLM53_03065 [Spirochaetota bacterium]|nr:hypothetical protein [Spirochaetota bacterium]HPC40475.1 hypothetical protein [Spirochaetota bacterium]HPL15786.1 hypothetical protein [Spirochaetota bacterium]HQF06542.1 hypothetical protein [Spirochaetota bacterium]HQH96055.1 hypothetical protein [Spirochaetota bacterium]